ncbi:hypothetical protein Tco_1086327, partial [Tanacetum coccineum]
VKGAEPLAGVPLPDRVMNKGRGSFARALIKLHAICGLKEKLVVGIPKLKGGMREREKNARTLDLNTNFPKLSDLVSKVVDANIVTNEAMESTMLRLGLMMMVTVDASMHVHGNSNVEATCVATHPSTNMASVLDNADYEFELPIASVHKVNGSLTNSLYGDNLVMVVPKLEGSGEKETIRIEYE